MHRMKRKTARLCFAVLLAAAAVLMMPDRSGAEEHFRDVYGSFLYVSEEGEFYGWYPPGSYKKNGEAKGLTPLLAEDKNDAPDIEARVVEISNSTATIRLTNNSGKAVFYLRQLKFRPQEYVDGRWYRILLYTGGTEILLPPTDSEYIDIGPGEYIEVSCYLNFIGCAPEKVDEWVQGDVAQLEQSYGDFGALYKSPQFPSGLYRFSASVYTINENGERNGATVTTKPVRLI